MKPDEMKEYIRTCAAENMNHARHVENERLNFTSIFFGLVMAVVAIVIGINEPMVAGIITVVLLIFSFIGLRLNTRWQSVFDEHIHRANFCQKKYVDAMEREDCITREDLVRADHVIVSYAKPRNTREVLLQLLGYSVLDLQAGAAPRAKDLFSRTRHMFAWIYILVVVLLLALLLWFLTGHGGSSGYSFNFNIQTDDDFRRLMQAILEAAP